MVESKVDLLVNGRRLFVVFMLLLLTVACAGALLSGAPLPGELAGWLLLFALPGIALLIALPADVQPQQWAERGVLAFGLSIVLSMLCFWLASQVPGPGIIVRWLVVEGALIVALALVALWQALRPPLEPLATPKPERERLLLVALVLLLAALTRLPNLGYGEYYDDELDVVQSARSLLLGQTNVIFEHRKGPTEIWFATVSAGTSTQFDETTTRLPFVLASLGAIAATALLGEEFFGRGRGLLAGAILAAEGIFLAFSRMVQYQSIVLLMLVLVAWCALRFWRAENARAEWLYLALGALCWSFGTLTHWDGVLSGVLLVYVVLNKWPWHPGSSPWKALQVWLSRHRLLLLIIPLASLLPALFYSGLILNPQVTGLKTYAGERIGFGIFNGVPAFMLHATFYDASPFIVALLALVGVFVVQHLARWRWLVLGLLLPFVWQDFLAIGNWNFSLLIFIAALLVLLRAPGLSVEHKVLVLWLFSYFGVYAFIIKSAGLHFYALMPALALLAALVLTSGWLRGRQHEPRARSALRALPALLLLVVALAFDAVAYLSAQPEYALAFPQTALAWSPTLYHERPRDFFFGFPYRYGWSVVDALYRQGVLRGKFESNETYLVTDWYLRDLSAAQHDEARYYLRVGASPRSGDATPDLTEKFHLWGEVHVHGAMKIQVYESNRYATHQPQVFDAEQFPANDPQRLARSLAYRLSRGDDNAFHALAGYLDQQAGAQDVLVLDTPLQDEILPYYYRGDARIVTSPLAISSGGARIIYASLFDSNGGERWLALNTFAIESRWFGSVRLASYAPALDAPTVQSHGAYFGYDVQLLDIQLTPAVLHGGDVLRLALRWQTMAPVGERFKVFIHVLDAHGNLLAQRDAEPVADLYPTSQWQVGEIISDLHGVRLPANVQAQPIRLALGLYNAQTNERMPVRSLDGQSLPDDQFLVSGLSVQ